MALTVRVFYGRPDQRPASNAETFQKFRHLFSETYVRNQVRKFFEGCGVKNAKIDAYVAGFHPLAHRKTCVIPMAAEGEIQLVLEQRAVTSPNRGMKEGMSCWLLTSVHGYSFNRLMAVMHARVKALNIVGNDTAIRTGANRETLQQLRRRKARLEKEEKGKAFALALARQSLINVETELALVRNKIDDLRREEKKGVDP